MGPIASATLDEAERAVTELFHCQVQRCAAMEIPAGSFDTRRKQYSSVAFMTALARGGPNDVERVIGLTECDLFIPMLTFVFGQAQLNGRVALVSLARMRQQFYGAAADFELVKIRLNKEIGHELGHSFGLIHCPDRGCLMSLATSIQDVDRKTDDFCRSCRVGVGQAMKVTGEENENQMADSGRR